MDEFDNPPADAPVGAHRQPPSPWRPVVPFLVVLVVVPLLAWGFTEFLMRGAGDRPGVAPGQSGQSQSVAPPVVPPQSDVQSPEVPVEPTVPVETVPPIPEPTQNPDEGVEFGAGIEVLNVAGVEGWGGDTVAKLEEAGFTGAFAGDFDSDLTVNTVYYQSPEMEPTARKVAEILGIGAVELDAVMADPDPIVVFLVAP